MPNRRRFIQASLAVPAATLLGRSAWAHVDASLAGPGFRPQRFIVDDRYQPAREAARVALLNDVEVMPFAGDPTSLWYHGLDRQWRERPMLLAGVTLDSGLFVLETLARDQGMCVWYHATHLVGAAAATAHTVLRAGSGPSGAELAAAKREWPGVLGTRLCEISPVAARSSAEIGCPQTGTHLNDESTLHSWVIGPKSAVQYSAVYTSAATGDFVS